MQEDNVLINSLSSKNILALTTKRKAGNFSIKEGNQEQGLENRKKLFNYFNIDINKSVFIEQVHGSNIHIVSEEDCGKGVFDFSTAIKATDGLITNIKNITLCILTADCIPIFMYCEKTNTIGLIHSGWKGTKEKILAKAIEIFNYRFGSNPYDIKIFFGPAIHKCCYEVGEEFLSYFPKNIISSENPKNTYLFDIIKENVDISLSKGIPIQNIADSGICTFCNKQDYFSYRAENNSKGENKKYRMLSLILMKNTL